MRKTIRVRLHLTAAKGEMYQVYVDDKLRYYGMQFTKREAHKKVETYARHCDIEWEAATMEKLDKGETMPKAKKPRSEPASEKRQPVKTQPSGPQLFAKEVQEKFWSLVEKHDPKQCWPWKGPIVKERGKTYPVFRPTGFNGHTASRYAYRAINPSAPERVKVEASCGNPLCCNPAHLAPKATAGKLERKTAVIKEPKEPIKKKKQPVKPPPRTVKKASGVSTKGLKIPKPKDSVPASS